MRVRRLKFSAPVADTDAARVFPDQRVFKEDRNHEHSIALNFMHYNFARIHKTLRVTPAMEAGLA
jgi:hypothetical protein